MGFSHRIAWQAGVRKIELWLGAQLLASREVSVASPQVTLLGPTGGSFGPEDVIPIHWTATDADSPALWYSLALSPDAGQTWLGYNDPKWLIHRHGARDCPPAEQVGKALAAIAADTVAK